jgi:hypothetical protein
LSSIHTGDSTDNNREVGPVGEERTDPEERVVRLEGIVVMLLEKNERLRQQLAAATGSLDL